ncbi:DUF5994 family protein [Nocardioides stalactiti]|uniref:DUF5994 family protein n=1 Tax=Nocardioides stalactiti TaxID=2755356 RepID=UPI0015FF31C5|nr:DUF5994 family protein [Nocardioides stalactiti]
MATIAAPSLRLQPKDLTRRPYGGGWWPSGAGVSNEVLDLVQRWPAGLPTITRYAYISDDWDQSEARVPAEYRTRTLILVLSDRSTCRLVQIPTETPPEVAEELLTEACDPFSKWLRVDFVSTYRGRREAEPAADLAGA